jgi:hypothetical protein
MTNREMLSAIKNVEPLIEHIESVVFDIIKDTFDYHIHQVEDIEVEGEYVIVWYESLCRGFYGQDEVKIPIKWFDEGFDFKSAYQDFLHKEEERQIKEQEEEEKKQKELQEKKEYDTYLKLKEKYENGENK